MTRQKTSTKLQRRAADKLDPLVRLSSVLRVVDTEEECEGSPSPACRAAFQSIMESRSDDAFAEAIRCAVRATKKSIHERVQRMANHEPQLTAGRTAGRSSAGGDCSAAKEDQ